jgi:hypothetical protein
MTEKELDGEAQNKLFYNLSKALLKDYCGQMAKLTGDKAENIRKRILEDASKESGIPFPTEDR